MKLGQLMMAPLFLVFFHSTLFAQVQFILDLDPVTRVYTVSMLPEVTWAPPFNKTATAQITVKAPNELFELTELQSAIPGIEWDMNSRVNTPEEAPEYDYLSFALITGGLEPLEYVAGKPTKLFTFKNATECSGEVSLINNDSDPFLPPNSRNANVGNSIAVHGARGEAYMGNVSDKAFACDYGFPIIKQTDVDAVPAIEAIDEIAAYVDIYPNPTTALLNIDFSWNKTPGEKQILLYNNQGSLVKFQKVKVKEGNNQINFDISMLTSGIYNILIVENGDRIVLGRVMKVD